MSRIAIINGKRVELPGTTIQGEELANMATNGKPGRRPIMTEQRGVSRKTIDRRKTYNLNELQRDDGKPIVISSIPERVKGAGYESAGTFFGYRSEDSKALIRDQVIAVAGHFFKGQNICFDEAGAHSVIIPKFFLPQGWQPRSTPLMIIFPVEYPRLPPTGFYIHSSCVPPTDKGGHIFDGRGLNGAFGGTYEEQKWLQDNNWAWYCAHIQAGSWSPAKIRNLNDWKYGDNLFTMFTLINEVLNARE
jgi:hypothetical protein